MSWATPPFPQYAFMAWCLVKHRDNFTFYLLPCLLYTRCVVWSGNKTKHISSTIKCIGEIDKFSNTWPHKVSCVLTNFSMGSISDTTHIKVIFCFLPGVGKHFIGNTHCSSDDCNTGHSCFALFHDKQCPLQTSRKNPENSNLENRGSEEMCTPLPIEQWRTLFPESDKLMGEGRWCTI